MTYPILTLPFDIISQIFVYCLPREDDVLPWRTEAPLLLAGICRDWRVTALATHELWNTIHLNLKPHSILKTAPLLDFWIPRAGNLPLSMSLLYKGNSEFKYTDSLESVGLDALAALVVQYCPHWSSIELHMPFPSLLQLSFPAEDFVALKKVTLNCGPGFQGGGQQLARIFSNKAPRLDTIHIISGVTLPRIDFPRKQVTSLRLDNSTGALSLSTLKSLPNIVDFTCTLWSFGGPVPDLIIPLPHLTSLRLILSHTRGPALLDYLTLPALRYLELDIQGPQEITSLSALIIRSVCFIRRFSVRLGMTWNVDHFLQLFTALDSLEELEIRKAGPALDAGLSLLKERPLLLPNLQWLHIQRTLSDGEDAELLADFLELRWNTQTGVTLPVPLKFFKLDSPLTTAPAIDSDAVLRLGRLRAEGMAIQITSSTSWFPIGRWK